MTCQHTVHTQTHRQQGSVHAAGSLLIVCIAWAPSHQLRCAPAAKLLCQASCLLRRKALFVCTRGEGQHFRYQVFGWQSWARIVRNGWASHPIPLAAIAGRPEQAKQARQGSRGKDMQRKR